MVTKSRKANSSKKRKVKVLSLTKETVKDLSDGERKRVKGGAIATATCPATYASCQAVKSAIVTVSAGGNSLSVAGHTYFNVSAGNSTIGF